MTDYEVTLRELLEARIESIEKSITIAFSAMQDRLAGMNEFRDALKDQASRFIIRGELNILMEKINEDIKSLRESRAMLEGKASQNSVYIAYLLAIIAIGISVFRMIN